MKILINNNNIGKLITFTVGLALSLVLTSMMFVTILDGLISFFWHHRELGNKEFWIVVLGLCTFILSFCMADAMVKDEEERDERYRKASIRMTKEEFKLEMAKMGMTDAEFKSMLADVRMTEEKEYAKWESMLDKEEIKNKK